MQAHVLDTDQRGCALANAAIELPEKDHPATLRDRAVQERAARAAGRAVRAIGVAEPELLADELFLLLEGARVSAQSVGPQAPPRASCAWARR